MSQAGETVILGRIVGLFGVKGWIKVFSYTDPRQAILEYENWLLKLPGGWTEVPVHEGKQHGKSVIARIGEANDRDAAAALLDVDIAIPKDWLPEPDEGSYYWSDLEGCEVLTPTGDRLGTVSHVLETGANDVLVVRGDTERLIPFVMNDFIVSVDIAKREIVADWEWD